MKVWKWFGLNNKEARIEMNKDNNDTSLKRTQNTNWHTTIQTVVICIVLAVGLYACSQSI